MKILPYIRKQIYDFFHPSPWKCFEPFAIIEEPITPEERDKCMKILKEWEREDMSKIFEMITEYASNHYYDKYGFNNEEFTNLTDEILKLQDQYANMGLTDEQKKVMDNLLKAHTEMCESCIEKIYSQGLKDSVEILQELGVLRVDICRINE